MPSILPPDEPPGDVQIEVVPAGTSVWRIHGAAFAAHQMNPTQQKTELDGGRFDSVDGDYSYLYFAGDPEGAMAERIFRDLPLDGRPRWIPAVTWAGLLLSELIVTRDLDMASCHGAALAHLGQDLWLTTSDPAEYVTTRTWASAIRGWAPDAEGLTYRCRNDNDRLAAVLFAPIDQQFADCLTVTRSAPLTDAAVLDQLQRVALLHNAVLG